MKLLIAIPSNRDWKERFGVSLVQLALHLTKFSDIEATLLPIRGTSLISLNRQRAIDEAVSGNFSHLLFLDDDMGFDVDAFDSLKSRNLAFVAANCVLRMEDKNGRLYTGSYDNEGKMILSKGKTGIQRVAHTGLAFALIRVSAFKNIPKPHFEIRYEEKISSYLGEDIYFCHKLFRSGIELYIDHDASQSLCHIGSKEYKE